MSLNHSFQTLAYVALLAEGVDRNMRKLTREHWRTAVALLAEGVDRNTATLAANPYVLASPSSRRAWIEITPDSNTEEANLVALLAEGVDRNPRTSKRKSRASCRPPRGGRG